MTEREDYCPAEGPVSLRDYPMRVGTKLKRTLYAATGRGRGKECDTVLGMVDTPDLAREIMEAVNAYYGHNEE
jgi:hypothetical protein